jgi:hypothetical protein
MLATALLLAAGCADPAPPAPPRDAAAQRAHDSMIGASALPGAGGVRGALRATDSADARRVREDSISNTP